MQNKFVNVYGCFNCGKAAGELTSHKNYKSAEYFRCPFCKRMLEYFWYNLETKRFEKRADN